MNQPKDSSLTSFFLLVCKMCGKGTFLQIRSHMLVKESVDRKVNTSIWFCWMKKTSSLIEDKKTARHKGPVLVGTPKGTSHWGVCYCGIKWWQCATSFGLYACDCGQAVSE